MKRKVFLLSKLLFSYVGLTFWSTLLTVLMFPYQVFKVFVPKRKPGRPGGHPWSRVFRTAFENKQTKKFIGASLTIVIMFSGVMNNILAVNEVEIEAVLIEAPDTEVLTETHLEKPLNGVIGQDYHVFHRAIDVLTPVGTEIRPITKGEVVEASLGRLGWGNTVVVDHGDGLKSRYAHLDEVRVIEGEVIDGNYVLGTVGMTGWTTGPHLHLEIYENGRTIDPMVVLPSFEPIKLARVK